MQKRQANYEISRDHCTCYKFPLGIRGTFFGISILPSGLRGTKLLRGSRIKSSLPNQKWLQNVNTLSQNKTGLCDWSLWYEIVLASGRVAQYILKLLYRWRRLVRFMHNPATLLQDEELQVPLAQSSGRPQRRFWRSGEDKIHSSCTKSSPNGSPFSDFGVSIRRKPLCCYTASGQKFRKQVFIGQKLKPVSQWL